MKNIFIINHYADVPKYGTRFRHFDIAKELICQGYKVCIIAASYTHLREEPKLKREIIEDVTFVWVKVPPYKNYGIGRFINMALFSLNLFFYKKYFPFIPDTVIVSSPSPFAIINGLWYKYKYKVKLIYEIRDVWPLSIVELKGVSKNNVIIILLDKIDTLGIKYSDIIMSPLHNIDLYVKEKGFKKEVIILPNGISDFSSNRTYENKKNNKFIVGYGGSFGDSNSIMNLVNAAILLKEDKTVGFKIIGTGERLLDIKKIIKLEKLKNIDLIDRVSRDELFNLLSTCNILYKGNPVKNIYKYGVSSIKMVEYLLLKKPIIDASYGVDLVEKSGSGIKVKPEDSDELVKGILKLKNLDGLELIKMGENGYNYVKEYYLYKNIVKNLVISLNN
jgi:glycosyltransferase involved in cell wall biosynthesis